MNLSPQTQSILKNFASINDNIILARGSVLRTIKPTKNLLAEATIVESIPSDAPIYSLNKVLSVLSMYTTPTLAIGEKTITVQDSAARNKTIMRLCDAAILSAPPNKAISVPDPEVTFTLSDEDHTWIKKMSSCLGVPNILVRSAGGMIELCIKDVVNDASDENCLALSEKASTPFSFIFRAENFLFVEGSYQVSISSKGVAHFKHTTEPIQYWLSTEQGSTYNGK